MLVYRIGTGRSTRIIASIRYELLRRGIQDAEKIRLLRTEAASATHRMPLLG
jgi:hypothetical protein